MIRKFFIASESDKFNTPMRTSPDIEVNFNIGGLDILKISQNINETSAVYMLMDRDSPVSARLRRKSQRLQMFEILTESHFTDEVDNDLRIIVGHNSPLSENVRDDCYRNMPCRGCTVHGRVIRYQSGYSQG